MYMADLGSNTCILNIHSEERAQNDFVDRGAHTADSGSRILPRQSLAFLEPLGGSTGTAFSSALSGMTSEGFPNLARVSHPTAPVSWDQFQCVVIWSFLCVLRPHRQLHSFPGGLTLNYEGKA